MDTIYIMEYPQYERWPYYYDKKYFSNIRDQQWVPFARQLVGDDRQKQLEFYYNNQEFVEGHKKVMNDIHMGWVYMNYDEGEDNYAVYKYPGNYPEIFW